jgi:hypothetical protein
LGQQALFLLMDDLFFGDSSHSVGLQVADCLNYVMWRYLTDGIEDKFSKALLANRVIVAKPEPEWSQYQQIFRSHEGVSAFSASAPPALDGGQS